MNILDLNKDIELNIISSQIYSLPIFGVFINNIISYPLPKPEFPIDLGIWLSFFSSMIKSLGFVLFLSPLVLSPK